MRKVLVTGDFDIAAGTFPDDVDLIHIHYPVDEQALIGVLPHVHGYILGGPEYLSADLIEIATQLKSVVVMGTGTSSFVDVAYATEKGIQLAKVPDMNIPAVADFTMAMITASLARVFESVEKVKTGDAWLQTPRRSWRNLKVGFVGMGAIAGEVAGQLRTRGCTTIRYWSRSRKIGLERSLGLHPASIVSMVGTVDVLCIHLTGCAETYNLIDETILANASPELKILNLSNPKIICPVALKNYLCANDAAFCLMDGYYNEWVRNKGQSCDSYGLLSLPTKNLVATSHLAAMEQDSVNNIFGRAVRILEGISQPEKFMGCGI